MHFGISVSDYYAEIATCRLSCFAFMNAFVELLLLSESRGV